METPRSVPVKYEDLQHMDYLDRVIKETLRLFPIVPVIARQLTEDIKMGLLINKYHIYAHYLLKVALSS